MYNKLSVTLNDVVEYRIDREPIDDDTVNECIEVTRGNGEKMFIHLVGRPDMQRKG